MSQKFIVSELTKTKELFEIILKDALLQEKINSLAILITKSLKAGGKVMFCGNGGSAADSQHLAAELISKLNFDRPALNAIALTVDTSVITSISNDYNFEYIFARQVEAIGKEGDILIALSTSGKSLNVLAACKIAQKMGIKTIGFLGQNGRELGEVTDYQINIPSLETPKIQEGHICIGHILCSLVEEIMFGNQKVS